MLVKRHVLGVFLAILALSTTCQTSSRHRRGSEASGLRGLASWYGGRFHGRTTASVEPFNKEDLTAAHRTLSFGTVVRVTNLANGRSVKVRINDLLNKGRMDQNVRMMPGDVLIIPESVF